MGVKKREKPSKIPMVRRKERIQVIMSLMRAITE